MLDSNMCKTTGKILSLHKLWSALFFICALNFLLILLYYLLSLKVSCVYTSNQEQPPTSGNIIATTVLINDTKEEEEDKSQHAPEASASQMKQCPEISPHLVGPLRIKFSHPVSLDTVRKENPQVQDGGRYKPVDCVALQKVAVIIPYRNREEHLKFWLYYLHPILRRQQLDYGVYVINQDGEDTFNRAKLMNVGYVEALKLYDYECFIFTDVDLIPMDDRNFYKCFSQPRHLSVATDKFNFQLNYKQCFGGASALSKEQVERINGFPNNYWGWGGEDDDMYKRIVYSGMMLTRPDSVIGRYRMIPHNRDNNNPENPQRFYNMARTLFTMRTDGLNTLKYKVVNVEKHQLYTKITVDLGKPTR